MRRCCLFVSGVLILLSCKTNEDPKPDAGLDYFPLKVGAYQIYAVEETQINQSVETKSIYDLKVIVVDSAINQEGGYTYTLQRQKRTSADQPWSNIDSWTSRIANRQGILKEGNTSFVNVMFPAVDGLEWDGNTYNTLGGDQRCGTNMDRSCDIYRIEKFEEEFSTSTGLTFAETFTVIQNEDPDVYTKYDVRKEVYAKNVGLIYKESTVLNFCTNPPSCYGQQKVNSGLKYKQVIKEYGFN